MLRLAFNLNILTNEHLSVFDMICYLRKNTYFGDYVLAFIQQFQHR